MFANTSTRLGTFLACLAILLVFGVGTVIAQPTRSPLDCTADKPYCNIAIEGVALVTGDQLGPQAPLFGMAITQTVTDRLKNKGVVQKSGPIILISMSRVPVSIRGEMGLIIMWDYIWDGSGRFGREPVRDLFKVQGSGGQDKAIGEFIINSIEGKLVERFRSTPIGPIKTISQ